MMKTRLWLLPAVVLLVLMLGASAAAQGPYPDLRTTKINDVLPFPSDIEGTGPYGLFVRNRTTASDDTYEAIIGWMSASGAALNSSGVRGLNTRGYGVRGNSESGAGVFGESQSGPGVSGESKSSTGVQGSSDTGVGVAGRSPSNLAVHGSSDSNIGVYGTSLSSVGVAGRGANTSGQPVGVVGSTGSGSGIGVLGTGAGAGAATGVVGATDSGIGVRGIGNLGIGVYGETNSSAGGASAIVGIINNPAPGPGATGVRGIINGANNNGAGVTGRHEGSGLGVGGASNAGVGVYGTSGPGGYAGYFNGRVHVNGALTQPSAASRIDHPLDPANKTLSHAHVESPDMMSLYNGNVTLDAKGEATVTLPKYFEALNQEFRYQLTAIGAPGPNLYIAEEIAGNQFKVAGGKPGMKVSWQVTGIRQDAFAAQNRLQVEQDKSAAERGTYLHPEAHGQPTSKSIDAARSASFDAQLNTPTRVAPDLTSTLDNINNQLRALDR